MRGSEWGARSVRGRCPPPPRSGGCWVWGEGGVWGFGGSASTVLGGFWGSVSPLPAPPAPCGAVQSVLCAHGCCGAGCCGIPQGKAPQQEWVPLFSQRASPSSLPCPLPRVPFPRARSSPDSFCSSATAGAGEHGALGCPPALGRGSVTPGTEQRGPGCLPPLHVQPGSWRWLCW